MAYYNLLLWLLDGVGEANFTDPVFAEKQITGNTGGPDARSECAR